MSPIAREALPQETGPLPETDFGTEASLLPQERLSRERAAVSAPQFLIGARFVPCDKGEALLRQRLTA